ncbi:bifunctional 5,10-methylene-tetrahydrofolate dehydrogenase/5,10-methylene-tetrahydrofolate cyclohydrolase [Sporolactobacillus sp. CPB3-1]|uniref:Bifunctional protein FolD n=1 Tax=Sporolactobacillus mangiferae TaxID=2940498 RepID=A0ABT0MCG8_9BACL|nr:tetrahydrofolate dehydrogenase/cyclohydrolase catalytic domain-containing protein [Sporolactobacillus mangiferae]MCL1632571.1 bifunctional 5,10-methylene-tetrahydrofolate dehydrogenase/5,10-methylene-tetrahydrofolate cyclohydrolase [Sporolactobacillus mangiferae]
MVAKLIDGKAIAAAKRQAIKAHINILKRQGMIPGLAVISIGSDPASEAYVRGKVRDCIEVGIHSEVIRFSENVTEEQLLREIRALNVDDHIHGMLIQLPLPEHISKWKVAQTIGPEKDIDGFHPVNIGKVAANEGGFVPCTAAGIIEMIRETGVSVSGQHVVIAGRSTVVGKPLALLFLNQDATVTICHSRTRQLFQYTRQADILVAATGKEALFHAGDIKPGAIVIDVGMTRSAEGNLVGDVAFEEVKNKASLITPVPGGVGPMTRVMLLEHTLIAAEQQRKKGS